MNLPIFNKKDFALCNVRVPVGYPQSQTHAGVAYYDGIYYLTCSPYPARKYSWLKLHWFSLLRRVSLGRRGKMIDAEKYENPMLYIGYGKEGVPPISFEPLQPFPLMDTPAPIYGMPAYNSDPDIFIEDGYIYILNRTYYRRHSECKVDNKEVVISLIRGSINENGFRLMEVSEFKKSNASLISPCLIKFRGKYLFMSLETNSAIDGRTFDGIYMQQSDTIPGLKRELEKKKITVTSKDYLPWHMSLFIYDDRLFAIVACVVAGDKSHIWQMLGEFDQDLTMLTIHPKPLTDYNSYRGAAIIDQYDQFHLYSTTLNDKVHGSKSVDGRDIIVASRPMKEVLNELKESV